MIAQNFEYSAPTNLKDALGLLASENTKVLAGGMSLIPLMKLRLASPDQLVDIARIPELNYIREDGGKLHIGATTTHYQVESSPLIRSRCPLLAEAASNIGDIQVRNQGTHRRKCRACRSRRRLSGIASGAGSARGVDVGHGKARDSDRRIFRGHFHHRAR